jgi:multidrug efflux system membrane fusion protein
MRRALGLLAGLAFLSTTAGCSDRASGTQRAAPAPAVPVLAAEAVRREVPLDVAVIGTVQALTTVGVKSQVSGQVVKVNFTEGQDVKAGQLLFTIDARPFEATVAQAEANVGRDTAQMRQAEAALAQRHAEVQQAMANLERDQAQLENARVQERRYKTLVDKELVAREQYDQFRTNLSALEATVNADRAGVENARAAAQAAQAGVDNARAVIRADEAMVETAKLNLAYTSIRAPMQGRTGNLMLQAGNVVKANDDNPMVVIAQVHPIYVSFAVPQQHLAAIKRYQTAGPLTVRAMPPGAAKPTVGRLTFVNNTVDPTTGTIQLKGTFDNADNVLWPGQYVEVVLTLTSEAAVVVPSQAVQPGQQGPYVFVVKPDLTVQPRPVELGRRLAAETIITKGLAAGERVVTDGQLRLVPGSRVEIRPPKAS